MKFTETKLGGSFLIDLEKREDERGFFGRYYCQNEFSERDLNTTWVQINNSSNKYQGTLRGIHFQRAPYSEVKLVRCIKGAIWDVIVDLRNHSETFGQWYGAKLTEENRTMMYVPKGFGHGFITLQDSSEIIYLVSDFYNPDSEGDLHWSDPDVGIKWPLQPKIISSKDRCASSLIDLRL